jgi:hypothetical protein
MVVKRRKVWLGRYQFNNDDAGAHHGKLDWPGGGRTRPKLVTQKKIGARPSAPNYVVFFGAGGGP